MNKYFITCLFLIVAIFSYAQEDVSKYLAGAVPEAGSKVVFSKSIKPKKQISDEQLFALMEHWANENYTISDDKVQNRVLITDPVKKNIACWGEKMLVFQKSALSLDQAKMIYQLVLEINDGRCAITVRNIKYDYVDSKDLMVAEEVISDKVALNKSKDKLNRYYDKFRIHTVNAVEEIYNSVNLYLNGTLKETIVIGAVEQISNDAKENTSEITVAPKKEETIPMVPLTPVFKEPEVASTNNNSSTVPVSLQGYKQIAADKIPGNIIKLLNDAMLITSGTEDNANVMTASWGGIGRFWEKPVAFCFLNPARYSIKTMDMGDVYTISFYTEAYKDAVMYCGSVSGRDTDKIKGSGLSLIKTPSGASAFSEAWMIIECRKIVAQPISADAVHAKNLPADWSQNGYHKMYIGEILNVWIK